MNRKKLIAAIGVTTGISYLSYKLISEEMFKRVFVSRHHDPYLKPEIKIQIDTFDMKKIQRDSFDGLKLYAEDIHNHAHNRYIIMVHGIWSRRENMYERAVEFDRLGYNVLIVDQRGAGESEGRYYTYGFKESLDLLIWIDYLNSTYNGVQICLYGVSMGAATVMMAAANQLPEAVKCIVEDCGYSSMKEELDHVLRKDYKLAYTGIVLKLIENRMQEEFGMNYEDVNIKKFLENNDIPILFVHGTADEFVPYSMAKILYNHNKGSKKFYPVENAGHTEANTDPDYYRNIDGFIKSYLE
ncbi:MAG: alpha/beta hydrolase [Erysipelotrichaceae bacterium]|nr:alpha/beta hydrolase [Erysipelotrichaceae bacterium]